MIHIKSIRLHRLKMQLNKPFVTSFGTIREKDFYLVEITDEDGEAGYGETVAFTSPWYTEETTETVHHMLDRFLIPRLLQRKTFKHPDELVDLFIPIKRNYMAKAAVEGAIWDLYAKRKGISLAKAIGGNKAQIDVGISLGIEENSERLLERVKYYIDEGYKRIKVKVNRERDFSILEKIRNQFPNIPLMVDANSAYTLDDLEHLKRFDDYDLMMIEQPLADDDIEKHAILQGELSTPVCLDESIYSLMDAALAVKLGSCEIINIKVGRVGGLTNAKRIHDYCVANGIKVWVGGMLDAGVGRAHNIALATLDGVTLPGDIGPSRHYWKEDIIVPEIEVHEGQIKVSDKVGIGYEIDWERVNHYRIEAIVYN